MKQRRLGDTALQVSEICLGTMTFGSMADEATSLQILDKAADGSVDFFDVAELYPVPPLPQWAGKSEEILGKWLKGRARDSVVIATQDACDHRAHHEAGGGVRADADHVCHRLWTLSRDFVASTIIGATRVEQLKDTLAAASVTLPMDVLVKLDQITREILYPMG
ncbi:MAG TPA: aldo/keto reductase [Polyangiales bacterium]